MDPWLKRGSLSKQLSTTRVNTGITDVSKSQHFTSPSSISNSRTAESSTKWATMISLGFTYTGDKIAPGCPMRLAQQGITSSRLLAKLTYTQHIRTKVLFFFTPKLNTATDCQTITVKS
jgi:hypothetical protein